MSTKFKRTKHPLYRVYHSLFYRCYNEKSENYHRYGGRGITVCDRWQRSGNPKGFLNFLEDMGPRPSKRHTLDRIDNDKGYTPENCRWSTWHSQSSNRENNNKTVGVCYHKRDNSWRAHLTVKGKCVLVKNFKTEEQAIAARKAAEHKYLGKAY